MAPNKTKAAGAGEEGPRAPPLVGNNAIRFFELFLVPGGVLKGVINAPSMVTWGEFFPRFHVNISLDF